MGRSFSLVPNFAKDWMPWMDFRPHKLGGYVYGQQEAADYCILTCHNKPRFALALETFIEMHTIQNSISYQLLARVYSKNAGTTISMLATKTRNSASAPWVVVLNHHRIRTRHNDNHPPFQHDDGLHLAQAHLSLLLQAR